METETIIRRVQSCSGVTVWIDWPGTCAEIILIRRSLPDFRKEDPHVEIREIVERVLFPCTIAIS